MLLDAQVTEFDGGVLVNWDVREDAFRPGVIDAMFAHHVAELNRPAAGAAAWDADDPPGGHRRATRRRDALNSGHDAAVPRRPATGSSPPRPAPRCHGGAQQFWLVDLP